MNNDRHDAEESRDQSPAWWQEMLSRREAGSRIARIAAGALVLPALGTLAACGDEETEEVVESDALTLQQENGWNVDATSTLQFAGRSATDSRRSDAWKEHRSPEKLLTAWTAQDPRWLPYVVSTLFMSLDQTTLRDALSPVHTSAMDEAYRRGLGMREIILKAKNPETMTIVADLPGQEAVAFAAALADVADPVVTFDNWPHPEGVVRAHEVLGAMLYYAGEVAAKTAERVKRVSTGLPAVFVLDSTRLDAPSNDGAQVFDNRYVAKLPDASALKSMKIANVLYAIPDGTRKQELDDLNEYFAGYREGGVNVSMLPLSEFRPETAAAAATAVADTTRRSGASSGYHGYHTPYHYGGGLMFLPLFFHTYPSYAYGAGPLPPYNRYPNGRVSRPAYVPTRRSTVFSSRTTGGNRGVGRTRPSGFGRVSRPAGGGSFGGTRSSGGSRSSGSFGRSRGGSSS